jgi:predicted outer membrane repeat protein
MHSTTPTLAPHHKSLLTALTTAALIATAQGAHAQTQTLYVDDDAPTGGNGTTWNAAFRELQDALDIANQTLTGTVEIRIAQGTYIPPNRFPGAREFRIDPPSILSASAFRLPHDHDLTNLPRLPIATHASRDIPQLTSGVTIKLEGGYAGVTTPFPFVRDTGAFVSILSGDILANDNGTPANRTDNTDSLLRAKMPFNSALEFDGLLVQAVGRSTSTLAVYITADIGAKPLITFSYMRFSDITAGPSAEGLGLWIEPSNTLISYCVFEDMSLGTPGSPQSASTAALALGVFGSEIQPDFARIEHCAFRRIAAGPTGALVHFSDNGRASVWDCTFENNSALFGAAIATTGASARISVSSSTFLANTADIGGAINGWALIYSSDFRNNTANQGGACHLTDGEVFSSTFTDNTAVLSGGAISGTPGVIQYTRFEGNAAPTGGACHLDSGDIVNSVFIENAASTAGGAVAGSPGTLSTNTFDRNTAPRGGAVWSPCCPIKINDSVFTANKASRSGGAVDARNSCVDIFNSTFTANTVHNTASTASTQAFGGAVDAQTATINTSRFYGNTVRSNLSDAVGGAVVATTLTASSTLFSGNTAVGATGAAGGAIASSQTTLTNVTLSRNAAECALAQPFAGGVATYGPSLIRSSILWNNTVNGVAATSTSDAVAFVPFFPITFRFNNITGLPTAFDALANTGANPLFADPDGLDNIAGTPDDDLGLTTVNSTCIDASDPVGWNNSGLDALQKPRAVNTPAVSPPSGAGVFTDRGAVEFQGDLRCTQYDLNGDGKVNTYELAIFLSRFGQRNGWGDFNADGLINTKDLVRLLSVFGCSRWS